MKSIATISRRQFHRSMGASGLAAMLASRRAFSVTPAEKDRPVMPSGIMLGDPMGAKGRVLWSRADQPARMWLEVADNQQFDHARRVRGPEVLPERDFTGRMLLPNSVAGKHTRVLFESLRMPGTLSEPTPFSVPVRKGDGVSFVWSGDVAGQGYGIDLSRGGMKSFATMKALKPDFFVHSGDSIYADGPFSAEQKCPDGSLWKNELTEATMKVAETQEEFWANYGYNLMDEHLRAFNAEVPVYAQWDDHETLNNWYPGEILNDKRYQEKSVSLLAARGKQAFMDYHPFAPYQVNQQRIYRVIPQGPLLDLFFLDLRSYRGANPDNGPLMARQQVQWFLKNLKASSATWKVICCDMPIGLKVGDEKGFENFANGKPEAGAREQELAGILKEMKGAGVKNAIWITADVHYAASHHYHPDRATVKDFDPFWEFVSGPLHAGAFGPGTFDTTFGPEVAWRSREPGAVGRDAPADHNQFFGHVAIDPDSKALTVTHYNRGGEAKWKKELAAS